MRAIEGYGDYDVYAQIDGKVGIFSSQYIELTDTVRIWEKGSTIHNTLGWALIYAIHE